MNDLNKNQYKDFILSAYRIIDVRSEGEFDQGHIPDSVNVPILNNEDRKLVGTCYKQVGSDEATELGYQLVSGEKKQTILRRWDEEIKKAMAKNRQIALLCERGGMRSGISQEWIREELGYELPRFEGGYKSFRRFFIEELEKQDFTPVILSGNTGSGKTVLLKRLDNAVDLEGLANHRGSAFGGRTFPQPSQANFENLLAVEMIKLKARAKSDRGQGNDRNQNPPTIIFESESRGIGRVEIPQKFFEHMHSGDYIFLDSDMASRVNFTYDDYVTNDLKEYIELYGKEEGTTLWRDNLRLKISKISRKLGAERTKICHGFFDKATEKGDLTLHKKWIEYLLTNYYDPMYEHHRGNWCQKIVKTGTMEELYEYFTSII